MEYGHYMKKVEEKKSEEMKGDFFSKEGAESYKLRKHYGNRTKLSFSDRLINLYDSDILFRALHTKIAQIFARNLQ